MLNEILWHEFETYLPSNCIVHHAPVTEGQTNRDVARYHIFGGGYTAGYYAYLWTQMLADDGYQWFVEQGGLIHENGQKIREAILSRGNSADLAELYRNWRGHDPQIEPMLENRGLSE